MGVSMVNLGIFHSLPTNQIFMDCLSGSHASDTFNRLLSMIFEASANENLKPIVFFAESLGGFKSSTLPVGRTICYDILSGQHENRFPLWGLQEST
jgi:hypothetical protein